MLAIMKNVLSINPFLAIHLALLFQSVGLILFIVFPKDWMPGNKPVRILYKTIKSFGFALYFLFALIFLDSSLMWILNAWTYADWRFQLPSVIIVLLVAFEILGYLFLTRPRAVDLLYFITSYAIYLWFFHIYVSKFEVMSIYLEGNANYVFGAIILIGMPIFYSRLGPNAGDHMENDKDAGEKMNIAEKLVKKNLWSLEEIYHRFYNRWVIAALWLCALIQSILTLNGYSLFYFF